MGLAYITLQLAGHATANVTPRLLLIVTSAVFGPQLWYGAFSAEFTSTNSLLVARVPFRVLLMY